MKKLNSIIRSMRPEQWTKNLIVFAGLFFGKSITSFNTFLELSQIFAIFCVVSSGSYIINDITDRKEDRHHPDKSKRPIAGGGLDIATASAVALGLILAGMIWAYCISISLFALIAVFLILHLLYDFFLKHISLIDVFVISSAFILRLLGGVITSNIGCNISGWILLCTFLLSIFLALCKRRAEIVILSEASIRHRKSLEGYSVPFLDQLITVAAACTILSYSLYVLSAETIAKHRTTKLIFTIPFVIYGVFRYLYLVHMKEGGSNPERLLLKDAPLFIDIILYGMMVYAIIYIR